MADMRQMDKDVSTKIAARLAELQGSRTDSEMAALLGCTRPHWWNIKNGQRRPSYALVKRAAQAFPDICRIVVNDVMGAA